MLTLTKKNGVVRLDILNITFNVLAVSVVWPFTGVTAFLFVLFSVFIRVIIYHWHHIVGRGILDIKRYALASGGFTAYCRFFDEVGSHVSLLIFVELYRKRAQRNRND